MGDLGRSLHSAWGNHGMLPGRGFTRAEGISGVHQVEITKGFNNPGHSGQRENMAKDPKWGAGVILPPAVLHLGTWSVLIDSNFERVQKAT